MEKKMHGEKDEEVKGRGKERWREEGEEREDERMKKRI